MSGFTFKWIRIIIVMSFAFMSIITSKDANASSSIDNVFLNDNKVCAVWLWDTKNIETNSKEIFIFLQKHHVNTIYLQINYSIKLDSYKKFIQNATDRKIKVHALEGDSKWALSTEKTSVKNFYTWLTDYQNSALSYQKFSGIHLDVEPYLNSTWIDDYKEAVNAYQDFINLVLYESSKVGLELCLDIPFWFDTLEYDNTYGKGILGMWVISHLKSVAIMAYRDKSDEICNLVDNEIKWANDYKTKVIIGVETSKSSEGKSLSFFEEGCKYMSNELNSVYDRFCKIESFKGFSIQSLESWMVLGN